MSVISTRIPDLLDNALSNLAKTIDRPKGYIIRKAIENYIEQKEDILIAMSRIEKGEESISIQELDDKYGLGD